MSVSRAFQSLVKKRRVVRFHTKHPERDKYHGVLLAAHEHHVVFRILDNFRFDGVMALPLKNLKKIIGGPFEAVCEEVMFKGKKPALPACPSWFLEAPSIESLVQTMCRRKLWPVIETKRNKDTALYIGPLTLADETSFYVYCYDSNGKWEKEYDLSYRDIFKVEAFDSYSTKFNAYMAKRVPLKVKKLL